MRGLFLELFQNTLRIEQNVVSIDHQTDGKVGTFLLT